MAESSNTCNLHGSDDVRNCVGYAIQSIEVGNVNGSGGFVDVTKDATGRDKPTYCSSSIDPWHSASVTPVSFGSEQHVWKNDGANSYADPDGPPVGGTLAGGPQATFALPKASVTVLRGRVQERQHRRSAPK
jgi:hypothetical protein